MATIFRARGEHADLTMTDHATHQRRHQHRLERLNVSVGNARHGGLAYLEWDPVGPRSHLVGLIIPDAGMPKGWRIDEVSGAMVPDRRTWRGRRAARRLAHIQPPPDPRSRFLGMPGWTVHDDCYLSPSVERLLDRVYLRWECDRQTVGVVDGRLWEEVPEEEYVYVREIERNVRAVSGTSREGRA